MSNNAKLDYLINTKSAIKTAINNKGISVEDSDTFRSYADKINTIDTGPKGFDVVEMFGNSDIQIGNVVYIKSDNKAYIISNNTINMDEAIVTLGYALDSITTTKKGRVRLLTTLIGGGGEDYAGSLTFSGSYATTEYYTQSGCSLSSDPSSNIAFVTFQNGTSRDRNIEFNLINAPSGITMVKNATANASGKNYYTCLLTGVTKKINVNIQLNDERYVDLTVTYA